MGEKPTGQTYIKIRKLDVIFKESCKYFFKRTPWNIIDESEILSNIFTFSY